MPPSTDTSPVSLPLDITLTYDVAVPPSTDTTCLPTTRQRFDIWRRRQQAGDGRARFSVIAVEVDRLSRGHHCRWGRSHQSRSEWVRPGEKVVSRLKGTAAGAGCGGGASEVLADLHQHVSRKVESSPKRLMGGSWATGLVTNAPDEVV